MNPVHDDEPLAATEETEAILARLLATPLDAPEPASNPKPRRARRMRIATAGVAFAAAASMLVALLPSGGESARGILAKAEAALSDANAIFHFVQVYEDLDESGSVVRRDHQEVWFTGDQRRSRALSFEDVGGKRGDVTGEMVTDPKGVMRTYVVATNTIRVFDLGGPQRAQFFDPRAFYREYTRAPDAKVDELEYQGRDAFRVTVSRGWLRFTLIVDAETYLPMLIEKRSNNAQAQRLYSVRYPTYERLEPNAETENLLEMSPHPGARTLHCERRFSSCAVRDR